MSDKSNKKDNIMTPYVGWGLTSRFDDIFDEFKRSFDQMMTPLTPFLNPLDKTNIEPSRTPFVDLIDEGDHYRINAELPGFTKDMVEVQVTKTGMTLRAERKSDKEERGDNYLRHERGYSALERRVNFPEAVNPDKVEGTLNNGVLELRIPKQGAKPEEKPRRVQLK